MLNNSDNDDAFEIGENILVDDVEYKVLDVKRGGMGKVYILKRLSEWDGIERIYRFKLAAKTFNKEVIQDQDINFVENELNIWITLEHLNIVPLLKIAKLNFDIAALMPFCLGSLRDEMGKKGKLPAKHSIEITKQIISGLSYAYKNFSVIHLDIKPENILNETIGDNLRFRISDWGISTIQAKYFNTTTSGHDNINESNKIYSQFGTLPYMAPERIVGPSSPCIQHDIFSIGIMLYEMLTGELPYLMSKDIAYQIASGEYFLIANKGLNDAMPNKIRKVILSCIFPDWQRRYSDYDLLLKDLEKIQKPIRSLLGIAR